ncbi:MAG TPA: hypothetical protein VID77_03960 [Stellaceae bacterium]|jgi:hypothetical protein
MDGPKQVGTIGDVIADGLSMAIYCERADVRCWNHTEVDLPALSDRVGADYRVADFVARSVCSRCGARWPRVGIRMQPRHTGGFRT